MHGRTDGQTDRKNSQCGLLRLYSRYRYSTMYVAGDRAFDLNYWKQEAKQECEHMEKELKALLVSM